MGTKRRKEWTWEMAGRGEKKDVEEEGQDGGDARAAGEVEVEEGSTGT